MTIIDELRRLALFVVFSLVQVLVFNHIHLFGYATVLFLVYFVVMIPRNYPRWALLLWAFFLGLFVDLFSNTPGMAAGTLTLTAFVQPYLLNLFVPREAPENMRSAAATMGFDKFTPYAFVLVFLYCTVFFTIEAFSFYNWLEWLLKIGGSTLLTFTLLLTLETIRK